MHGPINIRNPLQCKPADERSTGKPKLGVYWLRKTIKSVTHEFDDDDDGCTDLPQVQDLYSHQFCGFVCPASLHLAATFSIVSIYERSF
jgi:hypothetical protein